MLEKLIISIQILLIDIVMVADNAIIIGLIASNFATENRRKIIAWGVGAAFIFRIFFATGANYIFEFAWVKILGGVLLLWVINNLRQDFFGKNTIRSPQLKSKETQSFSSGFSSMMDTEEVYLTVIVGSVLCLLVDVTLLCITCYQLYIKNGSVSVSRSSKRLTMITMLCYSISTLGDVIHLILRYQFYLTSPIWNKPEAYLAGVKDIIYYSGNVTFFLLIFMQIKTSFQVSKYIMYYLSILLAVEIICSIIYSYIITYFAGATLVVAASRNVATSYVLSCNDFLLKMSLLILFVYKIRNRDSMEGVQVGYDDDSDPEDNRKAIWNVMIKHCLLFGIALCVNQTWYITTILETTGYAVLVDYSVRSVGNVINIYILWLALKVNDRKYVYLCECWHKCILKCCMKEDPDIIREGFVVNDGVGITLTGYQEPLIHGDLNGRVEGHNLVVTQHDLKGIEFGKNKVE